ncbi:cation:proton antiporter [Candidatus Bipolaricaulota sp. J31]
MRYNLSHGFMALGILLLFLGGLGFLRFRDPYSRLQAAGVADVGGALSFLLGLSLRVGWGWELLVLGALAVLLLFTGPVATHAIAKGAFLRRHPPGGER